MIGVAREQDLTGVGERDGSDLIIPAAAARGRLLDTRRQTGCLQLVTNVIDRRVESWIRGETPILIHEALDLHGGTTIDTVLHSGIRTFGARRNASRRLRVR